MNTETERSFGTGIVKVMMDELIQRQAKLNRMEKKVTFWSVLILLCLASLLFLGYKLLTWHSLSIQGNLLTMLTTQPLLLVIILGLAVGFIQLRYYMKKCQKAEDEFEELRKEVIYRSAELWEDDVTWKKREALFSYMKKVYDINLYHA